MQLHLSLVQCSCHCIAIDRLCRVHLRSLSSLPAPCTPHEVNQGNYNLLRAWRSNRLPPTADPSHDGLSTFISSPTALCSFHFLPPSPTPPTMTSPPPPSPPSPALRRPAILRSSTLEPPSSSSYHHLRSHHRRRSRRSKPTSLSLTPSTLPFAFSSAPERLDVLQGPRVLPLTAPTVLHFGRVVVHPVVPVLLLVVPLPPVAVDVHSVHAALRIALLLPPAAAAHARPPAAALPQGRARARARPPPAVRPQRALACLSRVARRLPVPPLLRRLHALRAGGGGRLLPALRAHLPVPPRQPPAVRAPRAGRRPGRRARARRPRGRASLEARHEGQRAAVAGEAHGGGRVSGASLPRQRRRRGGGGEGRPRRRRRRPADGR